MFCKQLALSALAIAVAALPALADTEMRQLSPSIILLGEPAPAEAMAVQKNRGRPTDVLAGGERRIGGMVTPVSASAAEEPPVAEHEKTSAIGAEPEEAEEQMEEPEELAPPKIAPLGDSELRLGQ